MNQRKLLIGSIIGVAVILIGGIIWSLNAKSETPTIGGTAVTFKVAKDVTAKVYTPEEEKAGEAVHDFTNEIPPESNLLFSVKGEELHKLAPGTYIVTAPASDTHELYWKMIEVSQEAMTLEVSPSFTSTRLQSNGVNERQATMDAITRAYPQVESLYTIAEGKFYEQGQWYGTKLVYKGTDESNNDTLRVVLHKEDNNWKVVTTPPSILVSTKLNPEIPASVATDVNFNL